MERYLAEVTSVHKKGFSFVLLSDRRSLFLHHKEVEGKFVPQIGDLLMCFVRPSTFKPGLEEAFNARIIKRADGLPVIAPADTPKAAQ